ncbi:MAG: polyprenol monophosphomannose synthase [Phycisphaerae bacterium]|nr:polyprenol monophosphomannose synthase [Phycisphaerae bacterium]
MTNSSPTVSIAVPTYNERDNLRPLVERLRGVFRDTPPTLIVVDDNSPDGTAEVAFELARDYPIDLIVRSGERGLATAIIAGLARATTDIVVVMDADLSHPPEAIPTLVNALASDASIQMAIGSRFVPGGSVDLDWPLHRRVVSRLGRWLAAPLTPRGVRDVVSGFFAVRTAGLQLNELRPIGYKIALELIVRHSWTRIVEVPIRFSDRKAGQTKLNFAENMRYLRHLLRLYGLVLTR